MPGRRQHRAMQVSPSGQSSMMVDSSPVLLWIAHADSEFVDINEEWERFTGVKKAGNLGAGWMQRIHPKDLAGWLKSFAEAFRFSRKMTVRLRLERHDGQYRSMLVRANPLPVEEGKPGGFAGCCVDITDEREIAEAVSDFSGRLIQAQEGERSRIARELHDDITQRMALLTNGIQELDLAENTSHSFSAEASDPGVEEARGRDCRRSSIPFSSTSSIETSISGPASCYQKPLPRGIGTAQAGHYLHRQGCSRQSARAHFAQSIQDRPGVSSECREA